MNIQSMTGYGKGIAGNFRVEMRSSNHRNLDIRINVPQYLYYYVPEIRKLIKEKFHRGHIELFMPKPEVDNVKLRINKSLAEEYYRALVSLKNELGIPDNVGIDVLAAQRDIFMLEDSEVEIPIFRRALEAALEELKKMRMEEGRNLADDISVRIQLLSSRITYIEGKKAELINTARAILTERLKALSDNIAIEDSRIAQEAAILVDRTDISEEIVRIKSHLKHMEDVLRQGDIVGKKIDFLSQELNRELNTIGSKIADAEISALIIDMKHEVERIKEQVQNLQ